MDYHLWIDISACLRIQDGGVSYFDELRMQDHKLTDILSNHFSKQKKERKKAWKERK